MPVDCVYIHTKFNIWSGKKKTKRGKLVFKVDYHD